MILTELILDGFSIFAPQIKLLVALLKKYTGFFIPYLIFLVISSLFLLTNSRPETHIFLNQFVFPPLNSFFVYYTYVGDGIAIFGVSIILLFVKFRHALYVGLSGIVSGSITNLLKNFVFDDVNRPFFYFKYNQSEYVLNTVLPEELQHIHNSFPSGHTTGAFCLFVCLMFIFNKPKWAWLFFTLAFLGGYSRIYLSQHFLVDVFFGSLIGTLSGLIIYMFFELWNKNPKLNWWNKSIFSWIQS